MLLLGEVLAPLAPSDEFLCIAQSCEPVQSSSERLLTSVREDAWLPQTPLCISSKMSLPFSQGMHFMSTPEVAPRLYSLSPTRT
jgi:hypothetical protein